MNELFRRRDRLPSTCGWPWAYARPEALRLVAAMGMGFLPFAAPAEVTIVTDVNGQYEHDSNVFDLPAGYPVTGTNDYQHSDSFLAYSGLCDVNYLWRQQQFFLNVKASDFRYDHFTELSHYEYFVNGGWNWKLGGTLDGSLQVSRDLSMVAFTDVQLSQLTLNTEQRETASIGWRFAPDWRLEGNGYTRIANEPIATEPNLQLNESTGTVALKYLARAGLTGGFSAGYLAGHFSGSEGTSTPAYRQTTLDLTASYQVSGASNFTGEAGYSQRSSATGDNNVSGVTGAFNYFKQMTGKTSVQLQLSRTINSYIATAGSEIDTAASVGFKWRATYKITVLPTYTFTDRDLPGQGNAPIGSDRRDHLQYVSLIVDYEPRRWLSIKPYANLQTRQSDYIGGNFNATSIGVNLTVNWDRGGAVPNAPGP